MNQEELRKQCKFLKWNRGISYFDIAKEIEMKPNSFYNFISGKKVKISHQIEWRLKKYIKEILEDE